MSSVGYGIGAGAPNGAYEGVFGQEDPFFRASLYTIINWGEFKGLFVSDIPDAGLVELLTEAHVIAQPRISAAIELEQRLRVRHVRERTER